MFKNHSSVVYKNVLIWRGCEKLYLDGRTADMFFVFPLEDGIGKKIPAHKAILSAISPVFDAIFYDALKPEGDIPIVDCTSDAFCEFLQFFYLSTVRLTPKNVASVMALSKKYMIDGCLNSCTEFSESSLTMENICWGYELAIQFEQNHLKNYCEKQIRENAEQIFHSISFLSCKSNILRHILQLDSLKCNETIVFDGCMAWAKRACIQSGLDDTNMLNLRTQLGDLFYEIRFGEMTFKEFYVRYRRFDGLFSIEEFRDIIGMIESKEYPTLKFNRNPRKTTDSLKLLDDLVCNRIDRIKSAKMNRSPLQNCEYTVFTTNCTVFLKKIYCSEVFHGGDIVPFIPAGLKVIEISMQNHKEQILYFQQLALVPKDVTIIELPTPIAIKPGVKYAIVFQFQMWNSSCHNLLVHKPEVDVGNGIVIKFHNYENAWQRNYKASGLVTRMDFTRSNEDKST